MVEPKIQFDDGASYEQMMGVWSQLAGEIFLQWLAPPSGLRWIDIGCGTGAFTELLVERALRGRSKESTLRRATGVCTHKTCIGRRPVSPGRCHGTPLSRRQI